MVLSAALEELSLFYNPSLYDSYHTGKQFYFDRKTDQLFWLNVARTYGDPILELACGTGRVTAPLAEQGFQLTGIDISGSMLNAARKKSPQVEWIQADIRDFDVGMKFPLILLPYFSIQHLLDLGDVESCLQCVKKHLRPNGRFIIDIMHPSPSYLSELSYTSNLRLADCIFEDPMGRGNIVVTATREYEASLQVVKEYLYYHIPGEDKELSESLEFRLYFSQEFEMLLKYNGFKVENKFGDYFSSPFTSESDQMILICSPRP
ncbi:MAG: class I SAM-dependent methyltransferase [Bacteroidota bacterium]